jgi:hypothetical protein
MMFGDLYGDSLHGKGKKQVAEKFGYIPKGDVDSVNDSCYAFESNR